VPCNECPEYSGAKPPLTPEEHLDLLRSRGLNIGDEEKAVSFLQKVPYARLRPYWHAFENGPGHQFASQSSFERIISIYQFDANLRALLYEVLGSVEVSLRASWIRHLSYGAKDPFTYIQPHLYHNQKHLEENLNSLCEEWFRRAEHEPLFRHYRSNYCQDGYPPAWYAAEAMSFGLLSRFFAALKHGSTQKRAIAADLGYPRLDRYFATLLRTLVILRNHVAHHSRVWDRRFSIYPSASFPALPKRLADSLNAARPELLYNLLTHLVFLNELLDQGNEFLLRIEQAVVEYAVPLDPMGFPNDYLEKPLWSG